MFVTMYIIMSVIQMAVLEGIVFTFRTLKIIPVAFSPSLIRTKLIISMC